MCMTQREHNYCSSMIRVFFSHGEWCINLSTQRIYSWSRLRNLACTVYTEYRMTLARHEHTADATEWTVWLQLHGRLHARFVRRKWSGGWETPMYTYIAARFMYIFHTTSMPLVGGHPRKVWGTRCGCGIGSPVLSTGGGVESNETHTNF